MLAFLLITCFSIAVLGDKWMKRYVVNHSKMVLKAALSKHHSEISTAVHVDSGSLSLGLDLEWGSRVSTTTTGPCESASTTSEPTTIASATATGQTTYMVDVGARGDTLFVPNQLNASVGDVIHFRFLKLNHTLTQSTLEDPCTSNGGFDTGFHFFNPLNRTDKILDYVVPNTDPAWFFCHQTIDTPHCRKGMVFGLNPAGNMNQYLANAKYSTVGTAVSFYPTGSAASSFPTGGTLVFPALPSGLKSVPPGVFYTGYAGTSGAGSGSYGISSTAISPKISSSTTTSHIPTATSDGIATSPTANSWAPRFLGVPFYYYAFLFAQMILVVV